MGKLIVVLTLLFCSSVWAKDVIQSLKDFFEREGYVVKAEDRRVLIDLGKDSVRVGEEFLVLREGRQIVHPVTGQVIGRERQRIGRLVVEEVHEGYSVARLVEGFAREGDRIKLLAENLCFEGSEELFFRVRSALPKLKRGGICTYTVKELKDGVGVEYRGTPIAFFQTPQNVPFIERAGLEDLNLLARPRLIKSLPALPVGADLCDLTGTGKEFLVVLYSGRLEVYELLKNDLVRRFTYSLPAGVPVGVQCGKVSSEDRDLLLVNMISGDSASSLILKTVGDSLVPVQRNIPYLLGVLDKGRPKETFIGQRFNLRDKFGQTVRLSLEGEKLRETGAFLAPRGFRIDSAFYSGDYLVFTDSTGRVRVFKGDAEVFSTEDGFGGSYTLVEVPVEQSKMNFIFNPRGASTRLLNFPVAFVVKNQAGVVQRFLDIVKYSRGELYMIGEKRRDLPFIRPVRGASFEEAVQAVLATRDGRLLVLTGRTGTFAIQNRGEVYELELRSL